MSNLMSVCASLQRITQYKKALFGALFLVHSFHYFSLYRQREVSKRELVARFESDKM